MTRAHARSRLWRPPVKTVGRPGIDDLGVAVIESHLHIGVHGDQPGVHLRVEIARLAARFAAFQRASFGFPFRQSAIEHKDRVGAEQAERPPHPGRGKQPGAVIHHDRVAVADAEVAHLTGELVRSWQHVRQLG